MNLDKDISSWAKVQPDSVSSMSGAAQKNVLTMALHDIAILGAEIERLRSALRPFANYADEKGIVLDNAVITKGSSFAKRQLTMVDCRRAAATLK